MAILSLASVEQMGPSNCTLQAALLQISRQLQKSILPNYRFGWLISGLKPQLLPLVDP